MLQLQDQSLRPLTTAHLAQTMSLLALSNLELRERILEELNANPALEIVEDRSCPSCKRPLQRSGRCPACSAPIADSEEPIVFLSDRPFSRDLAVKRLRADGEMLEPIEPAAPETLAEHVLEQLALELDAGERELAAYILAGLDEHGFLQDPPAIIARATRVSLDTIYRVLGRISRVDPPGLATSGPRQALLVQLEVIGADFDDRELARTLIEQHFAELATRDFIGISAALQVSEARVRAASQFIQEFLTPYPARTSWEQGRMRTAGDPNVYYNPDIQVRSNSRNGDATDSLIVEIFSPMPGRLRVNPDIRKAVVESQGEVSEAWSEHLERAALFVKCFQQRGNTMRRMMKHLVRDQRSFILQGDLHLIPMTRAELADRLDVHESTISRAVADKSIALPDGRILPLARFFERSLPIRARIREIVAHEDRPLTDEQIAAELAKEGVQVARRTVAKYRSMEDILPARLRRKECEGAGGGQTTCDEAPLG